MRFTVEEKRVRKFEIRVVEVQDELSSLTPLQAAAGQLGNYVDRGRVATAADLAAALAESRALRLHVLGLLGIKEPESE